MELPATIDRQLPDAHRSVVQLHHGNHNVAETGKRPIKRHRRRSSLL